MIDSEKRGEAVAASVAGACTGLEVLISMLADDAALLDITLCATGVVDQHVDAPVARHDGVRAGTELFVVAHVGLPEARRVGAAGGKLPGRGAPDDGDARTRLEEAAADAGTDALGASGHDHDFALFSFHPLLVGGNPFSTTSIYTLIAFLERKWGVYFPMGGTGALGTGLVRRWTQAGHAVIIGSRTLEKAEAALAELKQVMAEWGATKLDVAAMENLDAARAADMDCFASLAMTT